MKLTTLQIGILGKMRLTPMTGDEIRQKLECGTSPRAFAAALLRMRDRGMIDIESTSPVTYVVTPSGLSAYLDAEKTICRA